MQSLTRVIGSIVGLAVITVRRLRASGGVLATHAGTAGAVANAVWHATGVRVRRFPIQIEDLVV